MYIGGTREHIAADSRTIDIAPLSCACAPPAARSSLSRSRFSPVPGTRVQHLTGRSTQAAITVRGCASIARYASLRPFMHSVHATVDESLALCSPPEPDGLRPSVSGIFSASTPAPKSTMSVLPVGPCAVCSTESDTSDALFCTSCDLILHQRCISALLQQSGSCPCGNGVKFDKLSVSEARKRHRESSGEGTQIQTDQRNNQAQPPRERVPLKRFFERDSDKKPTVADLWKSMSGWAAELDSRESDRDQELRNIGTEMAATSSAVASNTRRIRVLEKKADVRHPKKTLKQEIIVAGIPGARIPEIKGNFIKLAKYLKVKLNEASIDEVRYMRRDNGTASLKLHTMVFSLHESLKVAELLKARKGTPGPQQPSGDGPAGRSPMVRPDMTLQAVFSDANMPADLKVHLRPMLTDAQAELLAKAKAAKERLHYKYAWTDDLGVVWLKRADEATPIQIFSEKTLDRLRADDD